jgi:hypothetical protein
MSVFHQRSYDLHRRNEQANAEEVPSIIVANALIDAWTHERMYGLVGPMYPAYADRTWLTVGDGGGDGFYIRKRGVARVIASCIGREKLDSIAAQGLLSGIEVRQVNAEAIDLPDDSVDVLFCKEAYHHFPRPPVAFYEFLRVAKEAVILIEPAETQGWRPLDAVKTTIKTVLRGASAEAQQFEPVGNFLFRAAEGELAKMATALQMPAMAVRYANSFFHKDTYLKPRSNRMAMAFNRAGTVVQDALCALRLMNYGLLVCIVFKTHPGAPLVSALKADGFGVIDLPRNPYIPHGSLP